MYFMGAEDWYFWEGLKKASEESEIGLYEHIECMPWFDTDTAQKCTQAFIDGYNIGKELSLQDYKQLEVEQ